MYGFVTFSVGVIGLIGFVVFRVFEQKRQERLFASQREKLDSVTTKIYRALIFGEIPHAYRLWLVHAFRHSVHVAVVFLVTTLRKIERPLSRMSRSLRPTKPRDAGARDPSPFLKTIAPDKKKKESEHSSETTSK